MAMWLGSAASHLRLSGLPHLSLTGLHRFWLRASGWGSFLTERGRAQL
jgi:hypothetical protein